MEKLREEEQKILSRFKNRTNELKAGKAKGLKEEILYEVKTAGYCAEDWQCHYSTEAIFTALQASNLRKQNPGLGEEDNEYISSWSWAAFFGGIFYTLGSRLYLWSLGYFVPFFNIFLVFYLGKKGRRLSYKKGWKTFEQFHKRQKTLGWIILILNVIVIGSRILTLSYVG